MRCGAARDLAALRRHIDGQWSLDQKALGRAAATGALGSARHGSAHSGGTQSVGQHGADPGETICRFRALPPCDSMAYIDASRSNPRTLSAPLWRIGRLRDFRAESVSQAIATSHGSEDERFDGEQRARPASRICDMRSLRPCRGRKGTFGRAQQGFIEASIEGCASLFRLYAQRGELNHQPPIPPGSLYSGKPPCSIPEPPPFLEHEKREAVQMGKEAVLI